MTTFGVSQYFEDNFVLDFATEVDHAVRRWGANHEGGADGLLDAIDNAGEGVAHDLATAPIRMVVQQAENAGEQLADTYEAIAEGVGNMYDDATGLFGGALDAMGASANSLEDMVSGSPGAIFEGVGQSVGFTAEMTLMGLENIGEATDKAIDSLETWADELGDTGVEPLDALLEPLGDAVAAQLEVLGDATHAVITVLEDVVEAANDAVQDAVDWAGEALNDAGDWTTEAIDDAGDAISDAFGWIANGGRSDEQRAEDEEAGQDALEMAESEADKAEEWAEYLKEREAEAAAEEAAEDDATATDGGRRPPVDQPGDGDLSNQMQRAVNRAADAHERFHTIDPIDTHGVDAMAGAEAVGFDDTTGTEGVTIWDRQASAVSADDLDDITSARRGGLAAAQVATPAPGDDETEASSHGAEGGHPIVVPDTESDPGQGGGFAASMEPPVEEVAFVMADEIAEIDLDGDDGIMDVLADHGHHAASDELGPMLPHRVILEDSE